MRKKMKPNKLPLGLFAATRAIAEGSLSPKDYLQQCLARADEREPTLHAFVARTPAQEVLDSVSGGEWAGIPVGVKDLIATRTLTTTNGSPIYADQVVDYDAPIVAHIRQLGAAVFGKTVTTEFAWRQPGPTVNPFHAGHTPGGSSSGSAAAVGAGIVPLALGTQTVGSVIRPAAFCGVVGFKASFGAVPRAGVFPLAGSLDHVGFIARSVNDVAYAFNMLRNRAAVEPDSIVLPAVPMKNDTGIEPQAAPRLAWLRTPYDERVTAEQQQAMERAVKQLRAQGAVIEEFALPDEYWAGIDAMFCLLECEGGAIHQEHVAHFPERSSVHLKELVEKGRARSALDYLGARTLQQRLRADATAQLKGFDAILTIPATGEAPEGLDFTGDPVFCALWSFLGLPALTVPIARSAKGLPLGLQLIAPYKQDAHLLRTGRWVELSLPAV
jgi:Asp-tRNA(Asn)/Glu-tRNA(Gln) amidotransferase A subunit family amidase